MKVKADGFHQYVARGDVNRCLLGYLRLIFCGEVRLREDAFHFEIAANQPLDDFFTLGNEQARLPRQSSLWQIAVAPSRTLTSPGPGASRSTSSTTSGLLTSYRTAALTMGS